MVHAKADGYKYKIQ